MALSPNREDEVKKQVEEDFAGMEAALKSTNIGVLDLLQVYGGLEMALLQADAYLSLLNPISPTFFTTDTSNSRR